MTKKHFIAIAKMFRNIRQYNRSSGGKVDFSIVVNHMADYCESQNVMFDRERFIDAINKE